MREEAFKQWMQAQGNAPNTISTRLSDARRVERFYGDLDDLYERDGFESVIRELTYSADDAAAGRPNQSRIPTEGDLYKSLASYKGVLSIYRQFIEGTKADQKQADKIREYARAQFIEPARAQGLSEARINVSDVHKEMALENAYPAVCSALGGPKFLSVANVHLVSRDGPEVSSTVSFLFGIEAAAAWNVTAAEAMLAARYRNRDVDNQKMVSFNLPDGRAIALQRDIEKVQLWLEDGEGTTPPPAQQFQSYGAGRNRHSNLPGRLKHDPPADLATLGFPGPVLSVRVASAGELDTLLDWYEGASMLDRAALTRLKERFQALYPDFVDFTQVSGGYWSDERGYKNKAIAAALAAITASDDETDEELGKRLLDILVPSGLLHRYMATSLRKRRQAHPGVLEEAAGRLVRSDRPADAIAEFLKAAWPILSEGQDRALPFGDSRTIPSMLLALVRPDKAFGINSDPLSRAAEAVLGRRLFKNEILSPPEYEDACAFARELQRVMRDDWDWNPNDLWDVQGFIYAAHRKDIPAIDQQGSEPGMATAQTIRPTNLILYGPPGTGKTYETAAHAVELCDGGLPKGRAAIMERYRELVTRKRVAFVTFHQSYSYEDFVEGLRPETGNDESSSDGGSGGFSLRPVPGIFRRIAELALANKGNSDAPISLDPNRATFKMSLGRHDEAEGDQLYKESIEGGYVVLGYGGDIDWSDVKYDSYEEIRTRWKQENPDAQNTDPNIVQLAQIRSHMDVGSLIIVSKGRDTFRAIGRVVGPYEFHPGYLREYNHRRAVEWLWHDAKGLPVDLIYPRKFQMQSLYQLYRDDIDWPALEQIVAGGSRGADMLPRPPEPYVLIVDEINRGNIAKIFGELITLIEPDKRLGEENELSVTLPYSGDPFGVPGNLHILGTMNTADRSIALLDTALRRRFRFKELMPRPDLLDEFVEGVRLRALLMALNGRIEFLFDRDHQIGHAYFMGCKSKTEVDDVIQSKVIPLLAEYFYEDWEKVRQALGETEDQGGFIIRESIPDPRGGAADYAAERWRYRVRDSFSLAAYAQLTG